MIRIDLLGLLAMITTRIDQNCLELIIIDHLVFMSFTVIPYNYNQLQDLITLRRIDYNQYPMTPRLLVLELECVSGVEVVICRLGSA